MISLWKIVSIVLGSSDSARCGFLAACGSYGLGGFGEAKRGHICVNGLVIALACPVGFMPDPDVAAFSHSLVKCCPCRQMRVTATLGVGLQILDRAPVLEDNHRPREPGVGAEESQLGMLPQLAQHPRHRHRNGEPFVD